MISKSVPARARTRTFAIGIDYVTAHTHQRAAERADVSFKGGVSYATAAEKAAWTHTRGVGTVATAAIEMEAVAALSARCLDPVYHLIIAYAKHEHPTRAEVVSDAERLLSAVGMDDHQYVLAAHEDTDDFHAHVIANRVGPDGRANDLWHERIIRERACAEIAAERGWEIVLGRHNRDIVERIEHLHGLAPEPERRPSDEAYRRLRDQGEPSWEQSARAGILDAVDRATDWNDLHQRLARVDVIVKIVQRGGRVQGLAFAESNERSARGCGATRIHPRCALSALERRFGPFTPVHEVNHQSTPSREPSDARAGASTSQPGLWSDRARGAIVQAVNAATSWENLIERLSRHGIVVKAIQRGERVQGLAFAAGSSPNAEGCAASRIDPRCKKAALEARFGPFPLRREDRSHPRRDTRDQFGNRGLERGNGGPSSRERKAERLREATRTAAQRRDGTTSTSPSAHTPYARVRQAYTAYRNAHFSEAHRTNDARRDEAWQRERALREVEAQRRREARQLLKAVARVGSRGVARIFAYWSIDATIGRRRTQEIDAARVRWQATKLDLNLERELAREEKPMDYREFLVERARAGDTDARRVLAELSAQASPKRDSGATPEPQRPPAERGELRPISLDGLRARLGVLRAEEEANVKCAVAERDSLQHVERPRSLDEIIVTQRELVRAEVAKTADFTNEERERLQSLASEQRSWNPLARRIATQAERRLRDERQARYEDQLAAALREFQTKGVPQLTAQIAAQQQRYQQYVAASFALEDEVREARTNARDRIPHVEQRLDVIERAGISGFEARLAPDPTAAEIATVVERLYDTIPEAQRRTIEQSIGREARARSRDDVTIGG